MVMALFLRAERLCLSALSGSVSPRRAAPFPRGKRLHFSAARSGAEPLGRVVEEVPCSQVPQLLDAVTSCIAPVASLSPAGNVVVLPEFELELATRPLSRDLLKNLLRIRAPVPSPPPFPARPAFPKDKRVRFRETGGRKTRPKASSGRRRSAMPKDSAAGTKSGSGWGRGKAAGKLGRGRGYGGGGGAGAENFLPQIPAGKKTKAGRSRSRQSLPFLTTPVVAILSATSSEESLLGDPAPPPRPPTPPRQKVLSLASLVPISTSTSMPTRHQSHQSHQSAAGVRPNPSR
ncbi:uncharacterized protein VSU04_017316 [Chlamydotis macqueenii]